MEFLGTAGVWLGLLIGVPAGMAVQHARHVVATYRTARTALPGQKKAATGARIRRALWTMLAVTVAVLALMVAATID